MKIDPTYEPTYEPIWKRLAKLINLDTIVVGTLLTMGVSSAIMSDSWGMLSGCLWMALFVSMPGMAKDLMGAGLPGLRRLGLAVLFVFFCAILAGAGLTAERIYLTSSDKYPAWLAHRLDGAWNSPENLNMLKKQCFGKGMAVLHKNDNEVVVRCGFTWEPDNTFIALDSKIGESR